MKINKLFKRLAFSCLSILFVVCSAELINLGLPQKKDENFIKNLNDKVYLENKGSEKTYFTIGLGKENDHAIDKEKFETTKVVYNNWVSTYTVAFETTNDYKFSFENSSELNDVCVSSFAYGDPENIYSLKREVIELNYHVNDEILRSFTNPFIVIDEITAESYKNYLNLEKIEDVLGKTISLKAGNSEILNFDIAGFYNIIPTGSTNYLNGFFNTNFGKTFFVQKDYVINCEITPYIVYKNHMDNFDLSIPYLSTLLKLSDYNYYFPKIECNQKIRINNKTLDEAKTEFYDLITENKYFKLCIICGIISFFVFTSFFIICTSKTIIEIANINNKHQNLIFILYECLLFVVSLVGVLLFRLLPLNIALGNYVLNYIPTLASTIISIFICASVLLSIIFFINIKKNKKVSSLEINSKLNCYKEKLLQLNNEKEDK